MFYQTFKKRLMKTENSNVDQMIEDTVVFIEENICTKLDPCQKVGLLKHLYMIAEAQLTKDYIDFLDIGKNRK